MEGSEKLHEMWDEWTFQLEIEKHTRIVEMNGQIMWKIHGKWHMKTKGLENV